MIPDYLTFIRFQDKRNLIYIYAIGLILGDAANLLI